MKKKLEIGIFFSILIIGVILRLMLLDYANFGLQLDEAEVIVEAQTILETGKDKEGYPYPLYFGAFGQGEAPFLSYILVPFFWVFGDSDITALGVMALIGSLTLTACYFVVKRWFTKEIALVSMFFLAISPWHLNLGRLIYNVTALVLLFLIGYLAWEKGWQKKSPTWLGFASAVFGMSFYCYPLAWLWVFLWLAIWGVSKVVKRELKFTTEYVKLFLPSILVFFGVIAPLCVWLFIVKQQAWSLGWVQFPQISDIRAWSVTMTENSMGIVSYVKNYILHFSPSFWLFDFNNLDFTPFFGLVYFGQVPLILMGFWYMYKNKTKTSLIWLWFFAAWIPSAMTHEHIPHPLRSAAMIPVLSIISAFGVIYIWDIYKNAQKKKILHILFVLGGLVLFVNITAFQVYHNTLHKKTWVGKTGYGARESVEYVEKNRSDYDTIIIDPRYFHWIYFARYSKVFRDEFQEYEKQALTVEKGPKKYGNICFGELEVCEVSGKTLFITKERKRTEGKVIRNIHYPDSDQVAIEMRVIKEN